MSQNPGGPNYNPYGPNPSQPGYPGTGYGGPNAGSNPNYPNPTYPPMQPGPGTNPNTPNAAYPPYQANPNTPNSSYGPYGSSNPYGSGTENPYAPPPTPQPPATGPNPYDPYAPTAMSQQQISSPSYPVYNPAPEQAFPPAQQPARPKNRTGLIVALGVLILLVIAGGVFGLVLNNNNQNTQHINATSTAIANGHITATAQVNATATTVAGTYPFSNNLVLNDQMTSGSGSQASWENDGTNCLFANGSYNVVDTQPNTLFRCAGILTNFADFTYQTQVTIQQGGNGAQGGVFFRGNEDNHQYYMFTFDTDGNYILFSRNNRAGTNDRTLAQGTIAGFTRGFTQVHTVGVVAKGNQISIYVDHLTQPITPPISDSTYTHGQIGTIAVYGDSKTVVTFNAVKVWQLA